MPARYCKILPGLNERGSHLPRKIRVIRSACTLDCPDGCALLVETSRGEIATLRGDPRHPITRGVICPRPAVVRAMAGSPERVLHPTLLEKGRRVRLGWDEALNLLAERLQPVMTGRATGLFVQGYGSRGVTRFAVRHLFRRLGFLETCGSLCDEAGIEAFRLDTGELQMSDPREILRASGIVLWGKDPTASSPHTALIVEEAVRGGAALAVVSPVKIPLSARASLDLRLRPGGDAALAALASRVILEAGLAWEGARSRAANMEAFERMLGGASPASLLIQAGLGPGEVERLAAFLLERRPASIIVGQGLQRYRHGCAAVRAINALAFLTGNLGRRGAGSFYSVASSRNLNLSWMAPPRAGALSLPNMARTLAGPPQGPEFVWISATNLVNQVPDSFKARQALERTPFSVAVEAFWNDTAEAVRLVLPPAVLLEREDVATTTGHDFAAHSRKAVEPPGEALSDFEMAGRLAARLGVELPWSGLEDYFRLVLDSPFLEGGWKKLRKLGFIRARRPLVAYRGARFPRGGFSFLGQLPAMDRDQDYPLRLLTLVQGRFQNSQVPPAEQAAELPVGVHPRTAAALGLAAGDHVLIESPLGQMPAVLSLDDGLYPEAVAVPRGGWLKMGRGINALIAPHLTDEGHCAAYYQQRVRLIRQ